MASQTRPLPLVQSSGSRRFHIDGFDIACVILLLCSFVVVSHLPAGPEKYGDKYFHLEAMAIAHTVHGTCPWTDITFARAPGPSIYYAIPYLFAPADSSDNTYWKIAFAWNICWMVVAILLIRRAGALLADERAGRIAAALSLIIPLGVYYSFGVNAETPAFAAAAIFLYGWARWRSEPEVRLASASTAITLFGIISLILCRPNVLLVLGIAALCAFLLWRRRGPTGTRPTGIANAQLALLTIVVALVLTTAITHSVKHLPANKGQNLQEQNLDDVVFFGSFQFRNEPWDWRFWGKGTRQGSIDYQNWYDTHAQLERESEQTGVSIYPLEWRWTIQDILHHPLTRLKMFAVRALELNVWIEHTTDAARFHIGPLRGRVVYYAFHVIFNLILLFPLAGSVWFVIAKRDSIYATWPLWGVWISLLLFHAFTYAEPRYMLPGEPGLVLMAACMLSGNFRQETADSEVAAHEITANT